MRKLYLNLFLIFLSLLLVPSSADSYVMCKGQLCLNDCDHCNICSPSSCRSVNGSVCFCPSTSIPGNLAVQYTPQFVYLSIRGGLKESFINQTNFTTNFLGNNSVVDSIGACVKPSLYVTNDELDYNVANWFSQVGSLGFQSMTNKVSAKTTATQMEAEFSKGIGFLSQYGQIDTSAMKLARNPAMQLADNWYTALRNHKFTIDSSVSDNPYDRNSTARMWPYTLDFGVHTQTYCKQNCPTSTLSGMWEFVVPTLYDQKNKSISLYQLSMEDFEGSMQIVQQNFMDNYLSNRSPFGLVIDRDWLYMNAEEVDMTKFAFLQQFYSWMGQTDNVLFATEQEIIDWMINPRTFINTKPFFLLSKRRQIGLEQACGGMQTTFCDYPNDRSSLTGCLQPDANTGNVTCPTDYPNIRNESCGDGVCVMGLDDCSCADCGGVCRDNWPGSIEFSPYYESKTYICGNAVFYNPINEAAMNFMLSARIFWGKLDRVIGAKAVKFDNITEGCISENWRIKPYMMSAFYPETNYSTIQICVNKTNENLFYTEFIQLGIEIIPGLLDANMTMMGYTPGCGDGVCAEGEHNLCDSDCTIPFLALFGERILWGIGVVWGGLMMVILI